MEWSGVVSGNIRLSGPKDALKIEAGLTASDGGVSSLKFTGARMDLEGIWPVLRFVSGQINDVSGIVYELKGQFNLKELSNFNFQTGRILAVEKQDVQTPLGELDTSHAGGTRPGEPQGRSSRKPVEVDHDLLSLG